MCMQIAFFQQSLQVHTKLILAHFHFLSKEILGLALVGHLIDSSAAN